MSLAHTPALRRRRHRSPAFQPGQRRLYAPFHPLGARASIRKGEWAMPNAPPTATKGAMFPRLLRKIDIDIDIVIDDDTGVAIA